MLNHFASYRASILDITRFWYPFFLPKGGSIGNIQAHGCAQVGNGPTKEM